VLRHPTGGKSVNQTIRQRRALHAYNEGPELPVGIVLWIVGIGILLFTIWENWK
jgi:hypothetical protein